MSRTSAPRSTTTQCKVGAKQAARTANARSSGKLASLQRRAEASPNVARLAGFGDLAHASPPVQRLSKDQKKSVDSYSLTSAFVDKHVAPRASRADLIDMATSRGVSASTLIRATESDIAKKAYNLCKSGDDNQAAAEDNSRYGPQIHVRMTGLERATIARGEFTGWNTDPFVIVGGWDGSKVEGNHFESNSTLIENDDTLYG